MKVIINCAFVFNLSGVKVKNITGQILAPNVLPVKRLSVNENKMTVKKLSKLFVKPNGCGLMKPKKRISLRNSAENCTLTPIYNNSVLHENLPIVDQPSINPEKSLIDSMQNNTEDDTQNKEITFKPLIESTNTPKIPLNKMEPRNFPTPRKNSFRYPSELTTENGSEVENVATVFNPSDTVDQNSDLMVENIESADCEKANNDSCSADSTVVLNEASPISRNPIALGNQLMTPRSHLSAKKTDHLRTPVNYPPLDIPAIKSSLKTKSPGPKKWVTFNNIVQAESQTRFINDFNAELLKTNNSKPETMQIDSQPIFVDHSYTHQSHCTQVDITKSEHPQISSQTNFVDDLYADSPTINKTKSGSEDLNISSGNRAQSVMDVLQRIK
ncbi:hypothetical protein V9T40_013596 [Parthenolecanium corni]|uniref:Uncharacterized protein n=1 Tax=Parthenolecanium corni TaxID=536013 RepID=A0AAN9TFA2_9HEMI